MKIFFLILAMIFNLNPHLNPNYTDMFQSITEELIVYGGANAGKSYAIADKLLIQSIIQDNKKLKAVVIRKTFPSLRASALDILEKRANALKLPFILNKSEWTSKVHNMTFQFLSLNNKEDYQKLKSMTDIDYIWINEATEIRENDYEECLRRLRGGQGDYAQAIMDFNPIDEEHWIHKRFFEKKIGEFEAYRFTVFDNHPDYLGSKKVQKEINRLKRLKEYNKNLYRVYFKGLWGSLEGRIFDWDVQELPNKDPDYYDSIWYGGDFGFSVDPAAVMRIYKKADHIWLEQVIYEKELTNDQLAKKMKEAGITGRDLSYWDSSEPKSIKELRNNDILAKPASKGPDSIRAGIDLMKSLHIHIVDGSNDLVKEKNSYVWEEDANGNQLKKPVDYNNHLIDAARYGIYTHLKDRKGYKVWRI